MADKRELYERLDFKNKDTIKQLLFFKAYFDGMRFISSGTVFDKIQPNQHFYSDLIDVYADLEELIDKSDLTQKNIELLNLVKKGYSLNYIYSNFEGYNQSQTLKMFDRITIKIAKKQRELEDEMNDDDKITERRGEGVEK